MRILALDLSLTRTGYARAANLLNDHGTITTKTGPLLPRLEHIADTIASLAHDAHLVVLEGPSLHSIGKGVCDRWGLRGIVLMDLYRAGIPFVEIPPTTLKKYATGTGNADKDAVLSAAIRTFEFPGVTNDEADAWILLRMAERWYHDCEPSKDRRAVLERVEWPVLGPGEAA